MPKSKRNDQHLDRVIGDALDASVQKLLAADPVIRIGEDPEGVHQARVATRRLRCDLRTFAPLLDADWVASLRGELRWLGGELGVAREAEVLLGHLRDRATALAPEIESDVKPIIDAARGDREAAQRRVLDALQTTRYLDIVDRLGRAAAAPEMRGSARRATKHDLVGLARRPWKKVARAYAALGPSPSDPTLHALRIHVKHARYAVEAVADAVGGKHPHQFGAALTDLQTVLGDHQDAVVAQSWLHEQVPEAGPPGGDAVAYAAGMLAGLLRSDALAATAALPHVWRRASKPKLRSWM